LTVTFADLNPGAGGDVQDASSKPAAAMEKNGWNLIVF
jgi:hypothetical protein